MAILYVGIDLAKNVLAVHGVDEHGKAALARPSVPRARLHELIASLAPCTVAMEACSGAHHWARLFATHGHVVRLIAPKFVAPYLRTMLILGARAVLAAAKNKADGLSRWALALEERRGYWKAVVAIAAKNARMVWAMLARGESFKMPA